MIPALSQLRNFVPSAPTLAVSLVTSIVLPIILKKCFPSMTPQKTLTFSYLATYAPLQWNSPFSGSQIVFNFFAALLSTNLGYGIAEKARGFFADKKKPATPKILTQTEQTSTPKILTQAEQILVIQHLFPSLSQAPQALGHSPAQETRYRALPDTEQIQKRKALYQTLYPLAQDLNTKIPYLKDYRGYDIYLRRQDQELIMTAKGFCQPTIRLASDGKYESRCSVLVEISPTICAAITVENGTKIVLEDANARWGKKDEGTKEEKVVVEFINKNGSVQFDTPRQDFLDHDNALMEFLIFKQEQIAASFQKEQWNARLNFLQTNILSLFSQIRKHSTSTSPSTALTSPLAFPVSESITMGPIWSPVAASQDSFFNSTIERDAQDNIYLEFKKHSGGRHDMGGSSSRTLRFQQNAKGELFVDILKAHSYDVGDSSSKVSYQLEFKNDRLFFIPLNAQSQSFCCLGGDVFKSATGELPAPEQMKADFELIISSLITVGDIIRSPESIIVDLKAKQDAISFTGNPISPQQAKQLAAFDQGRGCSGTMCFSAKILNPQLAIDKI